MVAVKLLLSSAVLVAVAGCTSATPEDEAAAPSVAPVDSASIPSSTAADGFAGAWRDATEKALGPTADWTNKVEVADLDLDGDVDLLFANGGDYETAGTPVASTVFLNDGRGAFQDATREVMGGLTGLIRVVKVADLDNDGRQDILLGATFGTQSRLLRGTPNGWVDVTATRLPRARLSVGDIEVGDVDADGDLDLVLADWGQGSPMSNRGAPVRLWVNDGSGTFRDAAAQMPRTRVGFSWDLELVDVDNDWDLDVAVSCKTCESSLLYVNDGKGRFDDVTAERMPAFTNNYEFAPIDLDGDGYLDLVTVNDGPATAYGLSEHVFRNDAGTFVDITDEWWPAEANEGWDDNVVVALDIESDGDADFLVGSLDGPDRLLVNDGSGHLTLHEDVFDAGPSGGTLGMAVADFDGDARPDVVEAQGEVEGHEDERVYLATDTLPPDSAPPVVRAERGAASVVARIHDNRTPNSAHDWRSPMVSWQGGERAMQWYGENLFRAALPASASAVEVCATDAAGNETCVPVS